MHVRDAFAFITGAAQGLGKAFAEALLEKGARVCIADIQVTQGRRVAEEWTKTFGQDRVMFSQCDVTSDESFSDAFKSAVSKFGHVNLIVNNAGLANESRPIKMMEVNLGGVIRGTRIAETHMRKDKGGEGGTIINISSTAGLTPVYFMPFYSASKYGVVGFHKSLASNPHLADTGVQYGCLCPAFTDTAMMDISRDDISYYDETLAVIQATGINKVEDVVKGFLQLVETENCNGDIITITVKKGIQYSGRRKEKKSSL